MQFQKSFPSKHISGLPFNRQNLQLTLPRNWISC